MASASASMKPKTTMLIASSAATALVPDATVLRNLSVSLHLRPLKDANLGSPSHVGRTGPSINTMEVLANVEAIINSSRTPRVSQRTGRVA